MKERRLGVIYLLCALLTYSMTIGMGEKDAARQHWDCQPPMMPYSFPVITALAWPVFLPGLAVIGIFSPFTGDGEWLGRPHFYYSIPVCREQENK